jgi:hypothetical protein
VINPPSSCEIAKTVAEYSVQSPAPPSLSEPPQSLVRAILSIARPLVRLLIARGVTLPYLTNLLKAVYVQVAETHFKVDAAAPSVSRLSVLTGLQRRDIGRIQDAPSPDQSPPQALSLGSRLMAIWSGDKRFLDAAGRPMPLPRTAADSAPSFDGLVREVSKDIRPKAILDELLRLGLAAMDEDERISLKSEGFVPRDGFDEKAYFFGRNLADHVATGVNNLMGEAPLLERAVYYDKLTPASLAHLSRRARELGSETLFTFNREALACADRDAGQPDADRRMALGVYYFEGPDDVENPGGPDPHQ